MFNLWLDDVRDPKHPEIIKQHLYLLKGTWVWARTIEEAIELLKTGHVEYASFDHDLGLAGYVNGNPESDIDYTLNARKVIMYLVETWNKDHSSDGDKKVWPKFRPYYHTANPDGRVWMKEMVERYGPYDVK